TNDVLLATQYASSVTHIKQNPPAYARTLERPSPYHPATPARVCDHAVPADAVGEPDAHHVDGKALADPPARGLRVSRAVEHRLHGHAEALLGEYLVQQLLADPEVFGRAPTVAIEGPHGTHVPREQPAGLRVVR